jgi:hypothetical protein
MSVMSPGAAEGTLVLRIGDTPLPFMTVSAAQAQSQSSTPPIRLPVEARSLVVEGDAAAARTVTAVELEPVLPHGMAGNAASPGGSTHRAVRYAAAETFFLDENAYPEPTGFWVAGGRTSRVLVASPGTGLNFFLRNSPVDNTLRIDVDGQRHELTLGAREERVLALPRIRSGTHALVRITAPNGFRPSETEPSSGDRRYLGCWVEIQ